MNTLPTTPPKYIIGVDPATTTGIAYNERDRWHWGREGGIVTLTWDCEPAKGKKPSKRNPHGTEPDPEYYRAGKLAVLFRDLLRKLMFGGMATPGEILVVMEDITNVRQAGLRAGQILHEQRGAVKGIAYAAGVEFICLNTHELKRVATGKASAEKAEMIEAARTRLGYEGTSHDEADALWLFWFGANRYGCADFDPRITPTR